MIDHNGYITNVHHHLVTFFLSHRVESQIPKDPTDRIFFSGWRNSGDQILVDITDICYLHLHPQKVIKIKHGP